MLGELAARYQERASNTKAGREELKKRGMKVPKAAEKK
jgi:hypothetical protein